MSVFDKYIYKNCFQLNNDTHDISNYLFDASFNNQPISNVNDCAEYAYYNNHPSFFFQNNNTNQQAKCYVFKYNHNNTNQNDKETQINTIINLNYDMNNNTNLQKYNFKEFTNEDDESVTNSQCTSHNNTFNFFMMKSFSNSYNLNSGNIHNRENPVANNILSEYIDFLDKPPNNNNDNINKFHTNFVKANPLFKNLYHKNINDNIHSMYYDIISNYINNTIYFVSEFGIGISKHTNTDDNLILSSHGSTNLNSYKYLNFNNNGINYFNNNSDSTNPIIRAHPFFLGLPLYILREHFNYIRPGAMGTDYDNFYTMFYIPKNYFENYYYDYINATFISFILDKIQNQNTSSLSNFKKFYDNYKISSTFSNLEQSDYDKLNNPIFHVESNTNYSFTLLDFLHCYGWCYADIQATSFSDDNMKNSLLDVMKNLYNGQPWYDKVDHARIILGRILLNLLVYKRKPNNLEVQKGMRQFAGVDNSDYNNTDKIIQAIKMKLYPDIIEKFLSTSYDYHTFSEYLSSNEDPYNLISRQQNIQIVKNNNIENYKNKLKYINIFKKIYTNQFRLNIIDSYFKTRIKALEYENNSIKADVNNIKTYIDNIYLHSKLNNIENYIYNEKSKLKYLFNKNSSEKQKNDDLKFLNSFILTENIVICIIIFILILFFIKK